MRPVTMTTVIPCETNLADSGLHVGIQMPITGDGPVIVKRQTLNFMFTFSMRAVAELLRPTRA